MRSLALKRIARKLKPETWIWIKNKYSVPLPSQIKLHTLLRYSLSNSDWIETGTYLAETAVFLAKQKNFNHIYSIEPSIDFFTFVNSQFSHIEKLHFLKGTSEQLFETALLKTSNRLNLWLDGHYSGDVTFKGDVISPIVHELKTLSFYLSRFEAVTLFVDDFRLFGTSEGYPDKNYLVTWANENGFSWFIEFDIFIARMKS